MVINCKKTDMLVGEFASEKFVFILTEIGMVQFQWSISAAIVDPIFGRAFWLGFGIPIHSYQT